MQDLNIVIATNKHKGIINRVVYNETSMLDNQIYTVEQFTREVTEKIKNRKIDIFLFDATIAKNDGEALEMVKLLRIQKDNMRIVFIRPQLKDTDIISQLISMGIYDIVNPDISEEDTFTFPEHLANAIATAIDKPKTFAMVVNALITKPINNKQQDGEDKKFASLAGDRVLRTFILFKSKALQTKLSKEFSTDTKFKLVGQDLIDTQLSGHAINNLSLLNVDLLLLEEPTEEEAVMVLNIVKILKNNVKVIGFFSNYSNFEKIHAVPELSTLFYDGSYRDLRQSLIEFFAAKIRSATQQALANRSKVIAVIGDKGGVGRTTFSVLLADAFANHSAVPLKTVIVDFNLFAGDIALKYNLINPIPNLYMWLAECLKVKKENRNLEYFKDQIENYVHRYTNRNVYVLPNPPTDFYDYTSYQYTHEEINEMLEYTIDALKSRFDVIILDTSGYMSNVDIAMLKSSDIVLVTDLTLPGIYRTKTLYAHLSQAEYLQTDQIKVIANKTNLLTKEYEVDNLQLLKESFPQSVDVLPYDKKLTLNFDNFRFGPSKQLYAAVLKCAHALSPAIEISKGASLSTPLNEPDKKKKRFKLFKKE